MGYKILSAAIGLWIFSSASLLQYAEPLARVHQVLGLAIFLASTLAASPQLKPVRWLNFISGAWLFVAPWLFQRGGVQRLSDWAAGFLLMLFVLLGEPGGSPLSPERTRVLPKPLPKSIPGPYPTAR